MGASSSTPTYVKNLISHPLTKAYFKTIKTLNYSRYNKNRYSKNNIRTCYQKDTHSAFSLNSSSKQVRHYIPWYYYLYNSLIEKERDKKQWAVELVDELEEKVFFEEPTHLSELFYEEFSIKHQPKELKVIAKEQDDTESHGNVVHYTTNVFGTSTSRFQSILNTTKHYGGSFMSVDIENINYEDPTQVYKLSRKTVKEYIHVFKEKISKQTHPINVTITSFVNIYSSYLSKQIEEFKMNEFSQSQIDSYCKEVSSDIRWFVRKIQTTIKWFYCRTIDLNFFNEEKDDMFNLVMSIVFDIGTLNTQIYELFKLKYDPAIKDLERKLKESENITPEDLGLVDKFCLNDTTRNAFKFTTQTSLKDNNPYINNNQNLIIEQVNEEDENLNNQQQEIQTKPKRMGFSRNTPYSKVIQEIKKMARYKQPFEKMIITTRLTTIVADSINEFWKNEANKYKKQFLEVTTDELITIFVYIVIKAQLPEIILHLGLIESFTPDETQMSEIGYGYTSLLGAVGYLDKEIGGVKDLIENGKKKKERE